MYLELARIITVYLYFETTARVASSRRNFALHESMVCVSWAMCLRIWSALDTSVSPTSLLPQEIDPEMVEVHRYVADRYSPKFPELDSLIPLPADFVRTVKVIQNEMVSRLCGGGVSRDKSVS